MVASGRCNRKYIKSLENKGVRLDNIDSISKEILHFFRKLYERPPRDSWKLEGLEWAPISIKSAVSMERVYRVGNSSSNLSTR